MFKDGTEIEYDNSIISGKGIIRGISTNGDAVIGVAYIVEDLSGNIPSDVYPYKFFNCFEIHLKGKSND